jgi:hypothetical protein
MDSETLLRIVGQVAALAGALLVARLLWELIVFRAED